MGKLLKKLQTEAGTVGAAIVAASTPEAPTHTDVAQSVADGALEAAVNGRLAWAVRGAGNVQGCYILPNGSTLVFYVNAKGTSAAERNAIHPAKRVAKEKRAKDVSDPLAGI